MNRYPRRLVLTLTLVFAVSAGLGCNGSLTDDDDDDSTAAAYEDPQVSDVSLSIHETISSIVVVSWEQLATASAFVSYGFDDGVWQTSPARDLEPGAHTVLLPGIPYATAVTVRVVNDFGDGPLEDDDRSIETGPLPEGAPVPVLEGADPAGWDPAVHYVMGSIDEPGGGLADYWTFILDRQGRVVWALKSPHFRSTLHAQPSYDGTQLLVDNNTFWAIFDGGAASQVQRLTLDGAQVELHDTPGLHHPFTDTPDGSLLWGASQGYGQTLERLHPDGTQEQLWVCGDFYAEIGHSESYCASNTVTWDETSEHVLFSLYSSDSVVEIDPESGESLRWFGHLPDAWSFDPEDSAFWWQHGVHYTEAGTLLVSAKETENGDETVVREYELDEESQTLVQVWTFGDGEGVYGPEMGEAHRLGNGNTLHNYGSGARVREITPDGEVVWDLTFSSGTYLGRTTPLNDLYAFAP